MTKRFTIDFDGHQYFLVIDEVNESCLARLDTRFDALAWLEIYKMLSEENKQLKQIIDRLTLDNTKQKKVLNATKKENEQLKREIQQLKHWNKCLAEKRHDILMKMDNIDYRYYVDNKTKKELEEMLNQKVLNCSDRD